MRDLENEPMPWCDHCQCYHHDTAPCINKGGTVKSFKAEVIADSSGKWVSNMLRFPSRERAENYVADLMMRWTSVTDTRVVECDDPVTEL